MNHERDGNDLELRGVRLTIPDGDKRRTLLDVPRLRVESGARVCLCGPSGSGKTSLLHLAAGLLVPDAGSVRWGGEEVSSLSEARRDRWRRDKLGLVFQDFQLVSGLNILENVLLPATFRFRRVPPLLLARARVLLEEMGLERPLLSVDRLSRGEMQRAAIARALLFDPLILLADEPTASLDRDNARTVLRLLTEHARRRGRTLLLVTHAPPAASAEEGVDRVLRLEQGRLEEEGDEA